MSFKILGIKFKITLLFAISLSLFLAFDSANNFFPLIVSITVHEFTHIFFLCLFNAKPAEVNFDIGTINIRNITYLSPSQEIIVLISGPVSNLILYLGLCFFENLDNFRNINLCMFFINILLVDGLDGGEIFKIILKNIFDEVITSAILKFLKVFNIILIVLLFMAGVHFKIYNYTLLFFGFYILISNKK